METVVEPKPELEHQTGAAERPIFIFGCPRSGTTFLVELLNRHPSILISNELRVMTFFNEIIRNTVRNPHLIHNWDLRDRFATYMQSRVPELVRDFYLRWLEQDPRRPVIWGDKTPGYADPVLSPGCLELIEGAFPGARFVHLVRDPRGVVRSMTAKKWQTVDGAVDQWARITRRGREFAAAAGPERCFELSYEALCRDMAGETARLLEFLGLDMPERVQAFVRSQTEAPTPFSDPVRTGERIINEAPGTGLDESALARIAELLGPDLADYDKAVAYYYATGKPSRKTPRAGASAPAATDFAPVERSILVGQLEAQITGLRVLVGGRQADAGAEITVGPGDAVTIEARTDFLRTMPRIVFGFTAYDEENRPVFVGNTAASGFGPLERPAGPATLRMSFRWPDVGPGVYPLTVGIGEGTQSDSNIVQCWAEKALSFRQAAPERNEGVFTATLDDAEIVE